MGEPQPLERLRRKLTIENLWLYVVSAILKHGPTYAYDVKKKIVQEYNIKPATITVYTVIYRLEKEGILEKNPDATYKVTQKGVEAYRNAIQLLKDVIEKLEAPLGKNRDPRL
ncbi:MAG: PadR family transcriptional regulator [Desulfurococcales archaeon]|nr:PadR family transcriptional regulator [Desulfurococcales archaeon]